MGGSVWSRKGNRNRGFFFQISIVHKYFLYNKDATPTRLIYAVFKISTVNRKEFSKL